MAKNLTSLCFDFLFFFLHWKFSPQRSVILWVLTAFNKHILNIITKQQSLGRFQKDVLSISDRSLCSLTLIWKSGFDWPPFVVKRINNNFWNAHKLKSPYSLAVKASGNPIIFYAKIKYLRLESIFQCKNSPGGGGGTPGSSWWVGAACSPNPHQKMSFSKPVFRPDL